LFQQRSITWGFQAWRAGGQQQCSLSPARLQPRGFAHGRNVCADARTHPARASRSSYAAAHRRLLPTSVSTNCFQETGWERKQALMKNPLVKNVFLQPLDYFVLERWGREIITTASLRSSLGSGDGDAVLSKGPVWGCPITPLLLSRSLLPHTAVGEKASAAGLLLCSALPVPGFGDQGSHLVPILQHPWWGHPVPVLGSQQMQRWLRGQQQRRPWGRAEPPAGCCYPAPGRKGHRLRS